MSSSDDEDLQRAIAMSLGQLDGTAEDEAMPSTAANGNTSEAPPRSPADATANTQQPASTRSINESLKRLDRKQLEAERLARQETRKRQLGTPASTPSTQDGERLSKRARTGASAASSQAPQVVDLTTPPRPPKQAATSADRKAGRPQSESSVPTPPASQSQGQAIRNTLQESLGVSIPEQSGNIHVTSSSRPTTEPQYLNGAVKKTWAFGCPRDNDIKLEEVLQNHDLKLLVLSAFNFDTQWWASKIKETTKQIWILGAENDEQKSEWSLAPAIYNNVEVRFPDLKNGKNHGKLLIGSHPKYLRIVITTANLTQHDWGETGFMENTVFLIDLPRLSEDETTSPDDLTPFGKELCFYLKSLKLGPKGCDSFLRFDWSRTKNLAFVHSLNGAKTGDIGKRTGLPGLSRAIKELGLESNTLEIDYATSSLGALSKGFMKQLLTAAKGENITVTKEKYDNDVEMGDLLERFRVYFPTLNTVSASKCGVDGGGTITLNRRWYNAPSFPKACMHDHKSTREGLLSHNKIILARGQLRPEDEDDEDATERKNVAWAYIGSHNLTQAAWGSLSTDRSTKSLKVSCRNYECGVIVPVVQENVSDNVEEDEVPRIEVFKEKMDIPFEVPGERYGDRKPWFFEA